MAGISNYLETALLNAVFRNTAYSSPTALYIALYTTDPTDTDTGTEVAGNGYTRMAVTFNAPTQVNGAATISNTAIIEFPAATASWGTITHAGIRDASTGGNLLYYGPLTVPKTIATGDVIRYLAGDLQISLD